MTIRIDTPALTAEQKQTNRLLERGVEHLASIACELAKTNEILCKVLEGGGDDDHATIDKLSDLTQTLKTNNDAALAVLASVPSNPVNPKK